MSKARSRRGTHRAPRPTAVTLPSLSVVRPRHGRLVPKPLSALMIGAVGGGLAVLGALEPTSLSAPPAMASAVMANSALEPAPLEPALGGDERASRSRRAAEPDPEPAPVEAAAAPVQAPVEPAPAPPTILPGCEPARHGTVGHANGRLPADVLCELPGDSDEMLRADAAVAFVRLAAAYEKAFDTPICLTDGYRTLGEQQQLRRTKPKFAARPGYSEHGWGLAVDLSCGVQSFRSRQHAWMVENATEYGWFLPEWAQRGGARPEPWHWEYSGE